MKKRINNFIVCFLPWFMWMIFGPMEIYMGNTSQFLFGYSDFIFIMSAIALIGSLLFFAILTLLPSKVQILLKIILFAFSVGSYIQVMFLNTGIDLLGVSPDATEINKRDAFENGIVWFIVLFVLIIIYIKRKTAISSITEHGSAFLFIIQLIALSSLLLTADDNAYKKSYDNITCITDEEQFTLSSEENIIVIILDFFSNQALAPMLEQYPGSLDYLHDFTYYDNTDCTYFGTFPSLAHLATGQQVDIDMPINEWFHYIWTCDETRNYYQALQDQGFVCNFYTNEQSYLCGSNDASIMEGCIDNLGIKSYTPIIDYPVLIKTLVKMGGYRMVPYIMKPLLYTNFSEYSSMVHKEEGTVSNRNSDFYDNILANSIVLDDSKKHYTVQHLVGNHDYYTAADGSYEAGVTPEENSKGCMHIMEAYLNKLKELGIYDNSTIIITSDHGNPRDSQVIFFMKEANETHSQMVINHAPVSFIDFQATIAKAAGLDYSNYGKTFDEISENEIRERTIYVREMNKEYPSVKKYNAKQNSTLNVYSGYSYTGDIQDLLKQYDEGPTEIIPMYDSFY